MATGEGHSPTLAKLASGVEEANSAALASILGRNARTTQVGRDFGLDPTWSPDAFREKCPLTTYADYEPYANRMLESADPSNIMVPGVPLFMATSGGTTGARSKCFPITGRTSRAERVRLSLINESLPYDEWKGPWLPMLSSRIDRYAASGMPVCILSTGMMALTNRLDASFATSVVPRPVHNLANLSDHLKLYLLFALPRRDLNVIITTFGNLVIDLFRCLLENKDAFVAAIAEGELPGDEFFQDALPDDVRQQLQSEFVRNQGRADELECIFSSYGEDHRGLIAAIWPSLRVVFTSVTGAFEMYRAPIQDFLGDAVTIISFGYASSEGEFIGIPTFPKDGVQNYVFAPGSLFLEFIRDEDRHLAQPPTCLLSELCPGQSYELVLTNERGLYRYRTFDSIEVVDMVHGALPVFKILGRANVGFRLVGGDEFIVAESELLPAIVNAVSELPGTIPEFGSYLDVDVLPGHIVVAIEMPVGATPDEQLAAGLAEKIDASLSTANPRYRASITDGRLSPLAVVFVSPGALSRLREFKQKRANVAFSQVKLPLALTDTALVNILKNQIVL